MVTPPTPAAANGPTPATLQDFAPRLEPVDATARAHGLLVAQALAQGDLDMALRTAPSVRGVAGNMGLTRLAPVLQMPARPCSTPHAARLAKLLEQGESLRALFASSVFTVFDTAVRVFDFERAQLLLQTARATTPED